MRGTPLLLAGVLAVTGVSCSSNPKPKAATTVTSAASAANLPVVSGPANAKPSIVMPTTPASAELIVKVLTEGSGPEVTAGKQLTAHYVGQIYGTGKQFDASWDRGQPATFPIGTGGLIKAWDQGLVGKKIGSRVLIIAPPAMGYGTGGNPAAGIKGTDALVFVVDLVGVK